MPAITGLPRPPSLAGAPWLAAPATQTVLACVTRGGGQARIVGGAVRNALLGRPVKDIDIATTVAPTEVMERAAACGLTAIPTGLAHGTVTLIFEHTPFEVTTLRRDVTTDGRRAEVAFTSDWGADAQRRDFTVNALYCDADGTVHDFVGGYADLMARRIRFIGTPEARIREDYLRILRFYRFSAEYAEGALEARDHAACGALQEGLEQISAERVHSELMRLLVAGGAVNVLKAMYETGLLTRLIPLPLDVGAVARLAAIENQLEIAADPVRRLAALVVLKPGQATILRDRLRLSATEYDRLANIALNRSLLSPVISEAKARAALYRLGTATYQDCILIAWVREGLAPTDASMTAVFELSKRWQPPQLPVRGADLLALGLAPGPKIGEVLSQFETWWIEQGFPTDAEVLGRRLSELVKVSKS